MGNEKFHLVSQHSATFQINILCVGRHERNRYQLHAGVIRLSATLVIVTATASRNDIRPGIAATGTHWLDMVPGQILGHESAAAIQAQVGIPPEERLVVERGNIVLVRFGHPGVPPDGRNDRIDVDGAAEPGEGVYATMDTEKKRAADIGNLLSMVQADRVPIVNPLQWHSGNIGPQHLLSEIYLVLV